MSKISTLSIMSLSIIVAACSTNWSRPFDMFKSEPVEIVGDAKQIEADMAYLADDKLKGREAGSEGFMMAAQYVAERLENIGVKPAGDKGTYFQTVPLRRSSRDPDGAFIEIRDEQGTTLDIEEGRNAIVFGSRAYEKTNITRDAVFAGYGIVAPLLGRDDYKGLDVKDKIVVLLSRTPSGIQSEERAYYGTRKGKNASDRGAVGIISIETPTSRKVYPFERYLTDRRMDISRMSWLRKDGSTYSLAPSVKASAILSTEASKALFANAPKSYDEIIELSEQEGGMVEGFNLPVKITLKQKSAIDTVSAPNVVGVIEGTDPVLKNEYIVLTAHLDHIGISKSILKDKINNGALDNASGIATLLDAARILASGPPLRRSVMILAVTAEEKGLLGAQYFTKYPTIPAKSIVANVNLDMPILTYDFKDLIVFGAERSTIAEHVKKVVKKMKIKLSPDPMPEQGIFTRSDHFRFVEAGVPSVYLIPGMANGGEAEMIRHRTTNYHMPSDDMSNSIDFNAAAKFSHIKARVAASLANADERPLWRKDDFFAKQFKGPMEE